MATHPREGVGKRYDPALMQRARENSWAVLHCIRDRMHPGINEAEAKLVATDVFHELGVQRVWHPVLIRIGADTTKTWRQKSDPTRRLGEHDSYLIDLGLVFDDHEGDVGDTFVVGHAPLQQACADAARLLFDRVADAWRTQGLSGQALYAFANAQATAMGWRFHHAIKGHRVSDFLHALHRGGELATLDARPADGLWILEIQITHPSEPFGAFYEDLLSHGVTA